MLASFVTVQVKPEYREAFIEAVREHASLSVREDPGCLRFDVVQSQQDPDQFNYFEVYRNEEASRAHGQAAHTLAFRERTLSWRVQPAVARRVTIIAPPDADWR